MRYVNLQAAPALIYDFDKVRVTCRLSAAYHADTRWNLRQRTLALGSKYSFLLELSVQQLEAFTQATLAQRTIALHSHAKFAPLRHFGLRPHH